jgi:hypothetical protein
MCLQKKKKKWKEFYGFLSKTCDPVPKCDMLIILGDLNPKIGRENCVAQVGSEYTIHNETSVNMIAWFMQMKN